MSHDFNNNSSPYTQQISSHNRLSKNYFSWIFTEELSKKFTFSDRMLWHDFFSIKSFNLPKKKLFNPSGILTIFGLFLINYLG